MSLAGLARCAGRGAEERGLGPQLQHFLHLDGLEGLRALGKCCLAWPPRVPLQHRCLGGLSSGARPFLAVGHVGDRRQGDLLQKWREAEGAKRSFKVKVKS